MQQQEQGRGGGREQGRRKIDIVRFIISVWAAGVVGGCAVTNPPPLPQHNPADPQVRSSSRMPRNLLVRDETTVAIERQLSATEADAKSAETMQHEMKNMPGIRHSEMHHGHKGMQHLKEQAEEKKTLENEMKKTSDEMEATSDAMRKKSDEVKKGATIHTCPMHPEVQFDKPGKCPKCGMKVVPKKKGVS